MSPTLSTRRSSPAPATAERRRRTATGLTVATALLLALTGCAQFGHGGRHLAQQVHEIGCLSRCQAVKDRCDEDARYDYRQCEAGYAAAQSTFRSCNTIGDDQCGYPWWSCSQNLYGYCTNRYHECSEACRRTRY